MKRWVKFIQSFLTMLKVCDDVDKRKSRYATWRKLYGFKNIKLETHRTVFLFPTKPKHTPPPLNEKSAILSNIAAFDS